MKRKLDFVTNSSSTSYLVFMPDNFEIRKFKDMILTRCEADLRDYCDGLPLEEGLEKFFKEFDDFINSGDFYQYEHDFSFYLMSSILNELELIITEESTGSDDGSIQNLNVKVIRDKIETIKSGGWGLKYGGWGHESKG
jgi:hypothetical protein